MTNEQQNAAKVAVPSFLLLSHTPLADWPSLILSTAGVSIAHGAAIALLAYMLGPGGTGSAGLQTRLAHNEQVIALVMPVDAPPAPEPVERPAAKPVERPTAKSQVKRPTSHAAPRVEAPPAPATIAVPDIPPPDLPKLDWKVQPDAVLASTQSSGNPAPSGSGLTSNSGGTAEEGIDAPLSMEELEKGPVYTPFSQAPELMNRPEIQSYLKRRYSGRLAMQGGLVLLWLLIDSRGEVRKAVVLTSSGVEGLDKAAMAAVDRMEFRPAINKGKAVPVWVQLPVRYVSE